MKQYLKIIIIGFVVLIISYVIGSYGPVYGRALIPFMTIGIIIIIVGVVVWAIRAGKRLREKA